MTIVTADANVRPQPGIVISQERLNPAELFLHDTIALTIPVRSACFEARYAPSLYAATEVWDMAAFSDLVSLNEARAYADAHPGWTGIPQARTSLALADENSWSPQETWLRLVWELEAGLPRPRCNVPIFDTRGHLVGTPDLFDPVRGVVGEYDGALHLARAQRARDVVREETFRRHGLEYVTIVAEDLHQPGRAADRIWSTYQRARPLPAAHRSGP